MALKTPCECSLARQASSLGCRNVKVVTNRTLVDTDSQIQEVATNARCARSQTGAVEAVVLNRVTVQAVAVALVSLWGA